MLKRLLSIGFAIMIPMLISASAAEISKEKYTPQIEINPEITLPVQKQLQISPRITRQPIGVTVYEGEPIILELSATGPDLEYQWGNIGYYTEGMFEGEASSVPATRLYANSNTASFTLAQAADYDEHNKLCVFCTVKNQYGSVTSDPAIITVVRKKEKPQLMLKAHFTSQPQSVTVNEGEAISFSVTTVGEDVNYRWSVEANGEVQTYFSDEYNKSEFTLTDSAVYSEHNGAVVSCYIFNEVGEAVSDNATVTVNRTAKAPVILKQPKDMQAYPGDAIMMEIMADGVGMNYRWVIESLDGTRVVEGSFGEGIVSIIGVFDPVIYEKHNGATVTCTVSNEHGAVTSRTATITVNPGAGGFVDIPKDVWFFEDVRKAVEKGLINGVSETEFAPYDNITIAATIKLAACLHQLNATGDITLTNGSVNWYDTYVEYAENSGIILRDEWDEAYDKEATRAEFVWIMYKSLPHFEFEEINSVADNAIPDVPIDIGFAGPIYGFYRAGILTGSDQNGTFYPSNPIQRCEVAAILTRMTDRSTRKFIVLPVPELYEMKGPMCWTAADNRFVFFTEKDGRAAVVYGLWESEARLGYVYRTELSENILTVEIYYPPIIAPDGGESMFPDPEWKSIEIDISGIDVDGKVKMRIGSDGEWYHYYPAGTTLEDGYKNVNP